MNQYRVCVTEEIDKIYDGLLENEWGCSTGHAPQIHGKNMNERRIVHIIDAYLDFGPNP